MKTLYKKKKLICLLVLSLLLAGLPGKELLGAENTQTVSAQMPFREMTGAQMVAEMGNGWNLGNTMDGHTGFTPSETIWQNVETSQEFIKELHDMGFNTIRIPVTWGTMIDDENGYAIDEKWMSRVQDIADYALNMNMYVIINIHHDGAEQAGWLRVGAEDTKPVKEKFEAVWRQIAERFKDYDEHVIFESMNEVTGAGSNLAKDTEVINEFNQIFVDAVRATGSNNSERWLSVPGRYTNITNTTNPENGFALPKDSIENRLFVAVHHYDWHFGLLETTQTTQYHADSARALQSEFKKLEDTFTSKGIPVILGEYGALNKDNTIERAYHMEVVTRICQQIGVVPCYWDQGWYDLSQSPDYSFTLIDRESGEQVYPQIISAMMRGLFLQGEADLSDITKDPSITPITSLGEAKGVYLLHMGDTIAISLEDVVKTDYNDVVLWKSGDESVVNVNPNAGNGNLFSADIHAEGIGNTVIIAYTQSGKAMLEIPVEVQAAVTENPCTEIVTEQESYLLTTGESHYLNVGMLPAETDAFLTYRSSDPDIISVSKIGKVVGLSSGSAYIIVTSSDGPTKVIPITVEEAEVSAEIALALNVYYNDSTHNYFNNESGASISVKEDGQYTLSFDCGTDLSDKATEAGVTGLNDLTAIYIKDDSVTKGNAKKSPLISCNIRYNSIIVDGVEYAINMTELKSALKASGIFDTNDPINSWDGSVIDDIENNNHVLNFTGVENPQHIEITFTLSELEFEEGAGVIVPTQAAGIEALSDANLTVNNMRPTEIEIGMSPADAGKVTFVSSDASIVSVDNLGIAVQGEKAKIQVYAHGDGEAVVTAYTANGLTAEFTIKTEISPEKLFANTMGEKAEEEQGTSESKVEEDKIKEGNDTMIIVLAVLGIIVLGVIVFMVTLRVAGGIKNKK